MRFFYDDTGDLTEAFDLQVWPDRQYNDDSLVEVANSYGVIFTLDKRSGDSKQVVAINFTFPYGMLDTENSITDMTFRAFLKAAYKAKTVLTLFDPDPDEDSAAYKGRIVSVSTALRGNRSVFSFNREDSVSFRFVLTAHGEYTDYDDIDSVDPWVEM
jgi:hypothetical protein